MYIKLDDEVKGYRDLYLPERRECWNPVIQLYPTSPRSELLNAFMPLDSSGQTSKCSLLMNSEFI